ncbi:MAG: peptidylprolyl isomerase [Leptolyngbyaceae cyanobacterium MO_188.B28]|nr:peptidylprolyl isomerase [Leptolyngbyaceae cyanobacterium MO_188.B28]
MRLTIQRWFFLTLMIGALAFSGCTASDSASSNSSQSETATSSPSAVALGQTNTADFNLPSLEGEATVELIVNGSSVIIQVDGDNAPITAGNFVDLVQRDIYNGLVFHRVVREPQPFVVQAGDPQGRDPNFPSERLGTGGFIDPDTGEQRYIPLEIKPEGADAPLYSQTFEMARLAGPPLLNHARGAVAMARSQFPDSASSQFYITLADLPFLDGNYAVFGYVKEGMDVVDQIQQGDVITLATVVDGLDNLKLVGSAGAEDNAE